MNNKVSIIIVTLNGEKTLLKLLDSINVQLHKEIEVILVDGGSTDNTVNIYKNYKFNVPISHFIDNTKEINIVDSYKLGFEASTGNYVMTIGHDDYFYDNNWLQYCVEFLNENINYSLIYGRSMMVDLHDVPYQINPRFDEIILDDKFSFLQTFVTGRMPVDVNAIIRKEVFNECFPNKNDDKCSIYTPHLFFYKKFYKNKLIYKFSTRIATCSINIDNYTHIAWNKLPIRPKESRQEKYKQREAECTRIFRRWTLKNYFNNKDNNLFHKSASVLLMIMFFIDRLSRYIMTKIIKCTLKIFNKYTK